MELDYKKKYSSFYGEIPNDWDVKLLPEVFDFIHGKAHEQHIDSSGAFTVVNSKFISSEGKVSKQSSNNFCPAKKGDILTVLSDLPNGKALAKTYYVNVNMKYAVNQRICIWRSKKDYPLFLSYIMNRHKYFMKFDDGVTQTHILNHHIEKCPVLVPSDIKEQKSIATALTDVDELISGLEKLISKKKDIKRGAAQALLSGKIRLNGFGHANEMKESQLGLIPKDWDVKLLPEVFNYIHGKAHEQHIDSSGTYTVVNSKFISSEGKVSKQSSDNFCPAKKGDILTVLSDLPNGKALAKTYYVNVSMKYAVNQRICIWRSKKDYPLFLSYIMNRHKYFMKFDDGVTQTHILNHHIEKCPVLVPSDINEQKAIAKSLNEMDAEITQLEIKKEKYQSIKQGMMQELLTGKTRLL